MNTTRIAAILLIVAGTLGLVYGGFSYTRATHQIDVGPMQMQINEKQRFNIPLWVGIGAIVGGIVLLTSARRA